MKGGILALILCAAATMLCACDRQAAAVSASSSADLGVAAELRVEPSVPRAMGESLLDLTLRDSTGQPLVGAAVAFDLTMPAMPMPPNRPPARDNGDGHYTAAAVFTMAGDWEVLAVVRSAGGESRFVFPVRAR